MEIEGNKYRTISGLLDGKKVTSAWTKVEGKNIGRSNETTPDEQALLEATARRVKKLEAHYYEDIKKIGKDKFVKAMLAHKFQDYAPSYEDFKNGNVYSQGKLDGIRCLVTKDGMFTRSGKEIISAPHIFEAVKHVFNANPNFVLDGELYTHALADNFEKIVSLAKKTKPTAEDLEESAEHLQYWVYDVVTDEPFEIRSERLEDIVFDCDDIIVFTPTNKVKDQAHLDELYAGYLADGMEGQMIRKGNSLYEGKRSKNLLKRKEFQDAEFEIVEITEGKGNWAGFCKSIKFKLPGGGTFDSGVRGSQEYTKELLARATELVGKEATVRYQNLTSDGVPRFPVTVHIWDDKRDL